MKVIFDISHPKQALFFPPMMERLRDRGCTVAAVTRRWFEINQMLDQFGITASIFGEYGGGGTLLGRLMCSAERVALLARHFADQQPDVLVTLTNPESVRAAFGLRIPIVCFADLPEADAVARLTLALSARVCAPSIVPVDEYVRRGADPDRLFFYHSLDPLIWLERTVLRRSYLAELGLDPCRPVVVCRESEWKSAYVSTDIAVQVTERFLQRRPAWQAITLPRYTSHPFYDARSLLAHADLFIGGGGTMCIEAAYYGTPVVATRNLDSHYMRWLFDRDLATCATSVDDALRAAECFIEANRAADRRVRARAVFAAIPFPLDEVVDVIIDTASGMMR